VSVFSATVFDSDVFDVDAVPVAVTTQGLRFDRRARAVPYRGSETGARVISPAEIRRARRRFRNREDEFVLGLDEWVA
jgi:hypothetical protein